MRFRVEGFRGSCVKGLGFSGSGFRVPVFMATPRRKNDEGLNSIRALAKSQ